MSLNVTIPSLDELLSRLGDEKKLAAVKQTTLKIKKQAKLSSQVSAAKVELIEAQSLLEDALISETADEAVAIRNVKRAQDTFDFYTEIYAALFPNEPRIIRQCKSK